MEIKQAIWTHTKPTFVRKTISVNMNEWAIASKFEGKLSGRLAWIQKEESSCAIWSSLSFIIYGSWEPVQYKNLVNNNFLRKEITNDNLLAEINSITYCVSQTWWSHCPINDRAEFVKVRGILQTISLLPVFCHKIFFLATIVDNTAMIFCLGAISAFAELFK